MKSVPTSSALSRFQEIKTMKKVLLLSARVLFYLIKRVNRKLYICKFY